jgi:hypothetical protein
MVGGKLTCRWTATRVERLAWSGVGAGEALASFVSRKATTCQATFRRGAPRLMGSPANSYHSPIELRRAARIERQQLAERTW